jgi:hypothetical protein
VASRHDDVFRRIELPQVVPPPDRVIVNPLYRRDFRGDVSVLTLAFPTPEYEEEFAAAKRYLPESVIVPGDLRNGVDAGALGQERYEELCRRMVFIQAPARYA